MENYKTEFIEFMIESKALEFGEFTLKSGRVSPFFINAGAYTDGSQLRRLGACYAQAIKDNIGLDFELLFGPAYKGIPLAVAAAMALDELYGVKIRYSANRKEEKDHGDAGIFLGAIPKKGDRIVIIEDVTTSGQSIAETYPLLKAAENDISVSDLVVSINRMERGSGENGRSAFEEIRAKYGMDCHAIVTMTEVVDYLFGREVGGKVHIDTHVRAAIDSYYKQYGCGC